MLYDGNKSLCHRKNISVKNAGHHTVTDISDPFLLSVSVTRTTKKNNKTKQIYSSISILTNCLIEIFTLILFAFYCLSFADLAQTRCS